MGLSADAYRAQLQALLPPGSAWSRAADAELTRLLDALAQEFARLDAAGSLLLEQIDPRTMFPLLVDWERVADLPGECGALGETLQLRRNTLLSRLTARGGQSKAFFIELARALGFTITISEYAPFKAGHSTAGDELNNENWTHSWLVRAPEITSFDFRAGQSLAGEPLRVLSDGALECAISSRKPAHTVLGFSYGL